jgi:hypothetical protein
MILLVDLCAEYWIGFDLMLGRGHRSGTVCGTLHRASLGRQLWYDAGRNCLLAACNCCSVSFFTHHRSVPLRTVVVSTEPIVLPAAVASKMTNARLSLHAFEDEYDNPGDSADSEADPVFAADLIVPPRQ